jgi:uncharacterized protein (TIGR02246 family)
MSQSTPPLLRIFDAYKAAVLARDVDALVALYDREVCVFDLWGKWSHHGVDAWREMIVGWFDSLGTERVVVGWDDIDTLASGDLATAHAVVTYQGVSAEGQPLRAMQNRLTWVLRQKSGAWKIVHEHTSAPLDPETMKAILKR